MTLFTRQLAGLLRAGLPLAPSLELIAQTPVRGGLPRIVRNVARDITQGVPFSDALARHPACFGPLYCQLVAVGELAGALPTVLARLADDRERAASQRARLRGRADVSGHGAALSLLITAGCWSAWCRLQDDLRRLRRRAPAPTRFVLALSDGVARWSVPFAIACVGVGIG